MPKKGTGSAAQNASWASPLPTVTGLYAETLKRKSATATDDESNAGYSTQPTSEGESTGVSGDGAGSGASDASADFSASIPQTYTARGSLSGPPPTAGEIFQATV